MAESRSPVTLTLPPFHGVTRRLVLIGAAAFFAYAVLSVVNLPLHRLLVGATILVPMHVTHGFVWTLATYPFAGGGLLSVAFALLSVWFFGNALEEDRGSGWLLEYLAVTTLLGGLFAVGVAYVVRSGIAGIGIDESAAGLWPFVLALVLAFARFYPEQTIRFYFVFQLKARHLAAIYLLVYFALALLSGDKFHAVLALSNALAGYLFLRFAPRRGLRLGFSESLYGLRNAWYRRKRRQAAKKFTVYMRKQGKEVSVDPEDTNRWKH